MGKISFVQGCLLNPQLSLRDSPCISLVIGMIMKLINQYIELRTVKQGLRWNYDNDTHPSQNLQLLDFHEDHNDYDDYDDYDDHDDWLSPISTSSAPWWWWKVLLFLLFVVTIMTHPSQHLRLLDFHEHHNDHDDHNDYDDHDDQDDHDDHDDLDGDGDCGNNDDWPISTSSAPWLPPRQSVALSKPFSTNLHHNYDHNGNAHWVMMTVKVKLKCPAPSLQTCTTNDKLWCKWNGS